MSVIMVKKLAWHTLAVFNNMVMQLYVGNALKIQVGFSYVLKIVFCDVFAIPV